MEYFLNKKMDYKPCSTLFQVIIKGYEHLIYNIQIMVICVIQQF